MLSEHNPQAWSALLQFIAEQAADILSAEMEGHAQASIESHQQHKLEPVYKLSKRSSVGGGPQLLNLAATGMYIDVHDEDCEHRPTANHGLLGDL